MSKRLAGHLSEQRLARASDDMQFLFSSSKGTPLDAAHVVKRHLQPLLRQLGLPRMGLHAFRHAHATIGHQWGVPLKVVQQRLGHASMQLTLDVYTHTNGDDERAFSDRLGTALCA